MEKIEIEEHFVFVGMNSLGYRHGEDYRLKVSFQPREQGFPVMIERSDGTGKCPYASLTSFMKNWSPV